MNKFLGDISDFIKKQPFQVIRISEYHNGGEIETVEFTPSNPCQNTYSIAKAFTMTAIGILRDRGLVSLNEKICDIFRDDLPENIDSRWEKSTVEMALLHRLGFPASFLDIDVTDSNEFGEDFLKYCFSVNLDYTPGEGELYTDGAYYLLSRIVSKKTGMKLDDFLWKEMFHKMKFREAAWSHCPMGYPIGATGLYIHSEDIIKVGMIYLNGGLYRGQRIVSEEWVERAKEKGYSLDCDSERKIFFKGGMHGQKLIIAPSQNRVVALQSYGANSDVIADFVKNYE
ncbi:MAG: beta-lactamase family protein [Clostridia bacterium]|nr:beta-lactamase family protein [Clostridia bacterium]